MDDDVATDILHATRRALCEHGDADLTLRDIAAETDTSKATIHCYDDGKADLFTAFFEFLYEQYTDRIESVSGDSPAERLRSLLDVLLATADTDEGEEFRTAMLEVSVQAPYDDGCGRDSLRSTSSCTTSSGRSSRTESTRDRSTNASIPT